MVRLKVPELGPRLAKQAVELVHSLRTLELRKSPSISETIDWAKALVALNADHLDEDVLITTLSVLLKHETDLRRVRSRLNSSSNQPPAWDQDDKSRGYRWRN